jgi:hypothetical protein
MLFVPPFSLDSAEEVCGDYTRERLEAMDAAFVAAVELAFAKGAESRAAAGATVRVGYRNGQQYTEAAIEEAWCYLRTNMDAGIDVSFMEVVARVRASSPGVAPERVREGIRPRLFSWIEEVR